MDPIAVLESAYALTGGESDWVTQLAQTIRGNWEDERWLCAWTYDAKEPELARANVCCGVDEKAAVAAMRELFAPIWDYDRRELFWRLSFVQTLRNAPVIYRRAGIDEPRVREFERLLELFLAQWRMDDELWINASDPTGLGCCIVAPMRRRGPLGAREKHRWSCIAAHVAAAFRIRRLLSSGNGSGADTPTPVPEAILRPDGRLDHAEQPAKPNPARAALSHAVRAMDRARGSLRRLDRDEAVATWRALVAGRWSLLDRYDSDGRRFVLAHRNDPAVPDARGLTLRERQILAYARMGHSNKVIAYELGLAVSTISSHLGRARAKAQLSLGAVTDFAASTDSGGANRPVRGDSVR